MAACRKLLSGPITSLAENRIDPVGFHLVRAAGSMKARQAKIWRWRAKIKVAKPKNPASELRQEFVVASQPIYSPESTKSSIVSSFSSDSGWGMVGDSAEVINVPWQFADHSALVTI